MQNPENDNDQFVENPDNERILDSIIDDDDETFMKLVSKYLLSDSSINHVFRLNKYKLPDILMNKPSYASLCAFFGSEKCFSALSNILPNGCESDEMKKLDSQNCSPVHFACAGGNLNILRELEHAGFDLDEPDKNGYTPSCYAAAFGQLNIMKFLWIKGAEIVTSRKYMISPVTFEIACLYGHLNIVKFLYETIYPLLDSNNQRILFTGSKLYGLMPMHYACASGNADLVEYLLNINEFSKNQINLYDDKGRNPLSHACIFGNLDVIKVLMKLNKANLHPNKRRHIPLVDAASYGHTDIVNFLLKKDFSLIYLEDVNNFGPLQAAIMNNHINVVKILLKNGAASKYESDTIGDLFLLACQYNSIEIAKLLDEKLEIPYFQYIKSKPNKVWGDQFMQQACILENIEMVSFLLEKNCNFNSVDFSSNVTKSWSPFLEFLNKKRNDLPKNSNDISIKLLVDVISTGNLKNVKSLISRGFELNKEIISQYKCISKACKKGKNDLFDFLISYKANLNDISESILICVDNFQEAYHRKNKGQNYLTLINKLLNLQDAQITDNNISRALIQAGKNCLLDIFNVFEKNGFDFTHCPLNFNNMKTTNHLKIFSFLEEHGCAFDNIRCDYCNVPCDSPLKSLFYYGCHYSNQEIIKFILKISSIDQIIGFSNLNGNIIDNFMELQYYKLILIIFQKCNMVLLPLKTTKTNFYKWIQSSNEPELIDYVSKFE